MVRKEEYGKALRAVRGEAKKKGCFGAKAPLTPKACRYYVCFVDFDFEAFMRDTVLFRTY